MLVMGCGPIGGVDLDGDGCREPVAVDGRMIEVGELRFAVGVEGDEVAVRDWDCDGESTPAVLRPRTGEVFVFARWDVAADVVVEPVATVAGGTAFFPALSPTQWREESRERHEADERHSVAFSFVTLRRR